MASIFPSKLSFLDFRRYYSPIVSVNHNTGPVSEQKADDMEQSEAVVSNAERNAELGGSDVIVADSSKGLKHGFLDPEEMRKVFDKFDENKDGVICSNELSSFMKKLGFEMSDEDILSLVKTVDDNSDGSVDFEEFYKLYSSLNGTDSAADQNGDEEDNLWEAFKAFDKDEDGYITVVELQSVLMSLGILEGNSLKKCQKMIASVDSDGNGQVDFKEFKKMMASNALQNL